MFVTMDPSFDIPTHRFNDGVPDAFWDELEDMIADLDLAFDDELITLKEKEVPTPMSPEMPTVVERDKRLATVLVTESVTAAPVGSLGQAIFENIKKQSHSTEINPIRYQIEAGLEPISSAEIGKPSQDSDTEQSKEKHKKRKKDKHKKKHKKEKKKKHKKRRSRSSSSSSSDDSTDRNRKSKSKERLPSIPKTYQDEFLDRYYAVEPVKKLQHTTFINVAGIPSDEENWDEKPKNSKFKKDKKSPPKPAVQPNIAPISDNEDNWDELVGMAGKIKPPKYQQPGQSAEDVGLRPKSPSPVFRRQRSRSPFDRRRRDSWTRRRDSRSPRRRNSRSPRRRNSPRRWNNRSPQRRGKSRTISPLSAMLRPGAADDRSQSSQSRNKRSPSPTLPRLRTPSPYQPRRRSPYQRPGPLRSKRLQSQLPSDEENWDDLVGSAGTIAPPPGLNSIKATVSRPPGVPSSPPPTGLEQTSQRSRSISNSSYHTIDEDAQSPTRSKSSKASGGNKPTNSLNDDSETLSPDSNSKAQIEEINDSSNDSDVVATGTLGKIDTQEARFDRHIIREKQNEDAIIKNVKQVLRDEKQPEEYYLKVFMDEYKELGLSLDDLLYREFDDKQAIWIPESIINDVIKSVHILEYDIHLSLGRTMRTLEKHYFWPFMLDTVRDFLKQCTQCGRKIKDGSDDDDEDEPTSTATPDDESKETLSNRESPKLFLEPPMVVDECANDAIDNLEVSAVTTFSHETESNSMPFFKEKAEVGPMTHETTSTISESSTIAGDTKTQSPIQSEIKLEEEQIVTEQVSEPFCFSDSMCNKMQEILQVTEICQEVSDPPPGMDVEDTPQLLSDVPASDVDAKQEIDDINTDLEQQHEIDTPEVQKVNKVANESLEDGELMDEDEAVNKEQPTPQPTQTVPQSPAAQNELQSEPNEPPVISTTNSPTREQSDDVPMDSEPATTTTVPSELNGVDKSRSPTPAGDTSSPIKLSNGTNEVSTETKTGEEESTQNYTATEKEDTLETSEVLKKQEDSIESSTNEATLQEDAEQEDTSVKDKEVIKEPTEEQDESLCKIESLVDNLIDSNAAVENSDTS